MSLEIRCTFRKASCLRETTLRIGPEVPEMLHTPRASAGQFLGDPPRVTVEAIRQVDNSPSNIYGKVERLVELKLRYEG